MKNTLYYGDNLDILKRHISDESVDLIYLDPPFKSGKNYNIIFKPELGEFKGATAQTHTFEDTWQWSQEAEKEYQGLITGSITRERPNQKIIDLIKSMRGYLSECSLMAYLCMMAPRLLEMKRVLKNTGSIYLHCDPTASHYLKLLMDSIFGVNNFRNEIVWCYYGASSPNQKQFPRKHDIIFWYSKSGEWTFNADEVRVSYAESTLRRIATTPTSIFHGQRTKRTAHKKGKIIEDYWNIPAVVSTAKERIGYPTQKPEALLEKIIKASSNEGDLVLDPFCGCGTTIAVAERLKRNWIGIDITYLAIDVIKKRFESNAIKEGVDFEVDGEPTDVYSAEKLAGKDPFQFQLWCISKLDATPSQTKSADQGVDGVINFIDPTRKNKAGAGIVQVKGTQAVTPSMVRELKGTLKSQKADFAVLITLKKPTRGMTMEGVKEGHLEYMRKEIPKIQLLTVEDLFKDPMPLILPGSILPPYKKPIIKKGEQLNLGDSG